MPHKDKSLENPFYRILFHDILISVGGSQAPLAPLLLVSAINSQVSYPKAHKAGLTVGGGSKPGPG